MSRRILIASMLAGALVLSACNSTDGASVQDLRAAAGIPSTSSGQVQATATTEPATATPAPLPTDTPDLQPETIAALATPQPVIVEVTRETVQQQLVEVTRIVQVEVTPQPSAQPTCDPRTPAPTVALDESDRAAGVVLRGQWPCYPVQP
jgi:predicted small secreted protein